MATCIFKSSKSWKSIPIHVHFQSQTLKTPKACPNRVVLTVSSRLLQTSNGADKVFWSTIIDFIISDDQISLVYYHSSSIFLINSSVFLACWCKSIPIALAVPTSSHKRVRYPPSNQAVEEVIEKSKVAIQWLKGGICSMFPSCLTYYFAWLFQDGT